MSIVAVSYAGLVHHVRGSIPHAAGSVPHRTGSVPRLRGALSPGDRTVFRGAALVSQRLGGTSRAQATRFSTSFASRTRTSRG